MDLLRFSTAGSVDDGKSTLIGRLLFDSKGVFEDQLEAVARSAVNRASVGIDLSLLTDGLRAEREQGITIDVAYRYFATPKRKFIIADTPGHEQYTRNMATGASTAQLAIVLIDARHGVLVQSRRHSFIAALLGISHVVVAVNKMDLVDWSEQRFQEIVRDYVEFSKDLGIRNLYFVPLSALLGDNVVDRSANTPWYQGPTLLDLLETADAGEEENRAALRFPVQLVIRPNLDFRGFAGQISAGQVAVGDEVVAFPAGTRSKVKRIHTFSGDLQRAEAPQSVTVLLEDEIDVSRGDMLVHPDQLPWMRTDFDAHLVWMDGQALDLNRPYLIRHTSRTVRVKVAEILHRVDVATLKHEAADKLQLNEIAKVRIKAAQALFLDPYPEFRRTGCFVLVDPLSNATVAAGMIAAQQPSEAELAVHLPRVDRQARQAQSGHRAGVLWLRGGPAVLQAEAAQQLEARLFQRGAHVLVLDEAALRPLEGEGDQAEERSRRLAALANLLVRSGQLAIVASDERGTHLQAHVPADDLLIIDLGESSDAESAAAAALKLASESGWLGAAGVVSIGAGI